MRMGLAVVAGLAACRSENELRFTATLQAETNGVALSDDGLDGYAGMVGTTCTIDTNWGCPTGDTDVTVSAEERIVDHYRGRTLATSEAGLHTLVAEEWDAADDVLVEGLRTAALVDDGRVMLSGTPDRCWYDLGDGAFEVDGAACEDGVRFSVDRGGARLITVTRGAVLALGGDGARTVSERGDLAVWDPKLELLYVAVSGERDLWALDRAGEEVWDVRAGGPIVGLAARGRRGEVLVEIERADGLGGVERRDGRTGRLLGRSLLPDTGGEIVISDNGRTVAVVRDDEVNFFDLETEGDEDPVVDDTPPECVTPTVGGGGVNLGD